MVKIHRSAIVEYSVAQMFELVNDVEHYPLFMQGCASAKVLEEDDEFLVGELVVSKAGITQTIITRNILDFPESIEVELVEGNFNRFSARWDFLELNETASKVSLRMEFEIKPGIIDLALEKLISVSGNNLVDALVDRAHVVYGAKGS